MADLRKFFKKTAPKEEAEAVPSVPEGLWVKCPKCGETVYKETFAIIPTFVQNAADISVLRQRRESVLL